MTRPMSWPFDLVFGVRFRLHPLFTLMLILSVLTGHFLELVTLFGIVLIHELGHAAMARHLGWRMQEIQLTPFGGVAVTDEDGSIPAKEEALVAIAGPVMNALMIGFAFLMLAAGVWSRIWTAYFVQINMTLLLFNLAPISPLDGGKLLRVLVGYTLPYYRTLKGIAYWSMLASGALVGFASTRLGEGGLELNLLFIGMFLLYANWQEWRTTPYRFVRFLLGRGARVRTWIERGRSAHPIAVRPEAPLAAVVRLLRRERLHWIVVMTATGHVLAVIPEERCTAHYLEKEQSRAVSELFM